MIIQPIQITKTDWPNFIQLSKEWAEKDPTKVFEDTYITKDHPEAFVGSLDFKHLQHCVLTFMVKMTEDEWKHIVQYAQENFSWHNGYYLTTNHLQYWIDRCCRYCQEQSPKNVRLFYNYIYQALEEIGFKYFNYSTLYSSDGTFVILHD
jgi:hypothetical protein